MLSLIMIKYIYGDIFLEENLSNAIVAHGCNAQGVMGKGFAKIVRKKFPKCFKLYKQRHVANGLKTGEIVWYSHEDGLVIANCITQEFYGYNKDFLDYDAIDVIMNSLCLSAAERCVPLRMPQIGAMLGGGSWDRTSSIIERNAIKHGITVEVYTLDRDRYDKLTQNNK